MKSIVTASGLLLIATLMAIGSTSLAEEIDIGGSTMEILSNDQFILHGVLMEDKIYWGKFKWDPAHNIFDVESHGLESGFYESFNDGVANNWIDDGTGRWEVSNSLYTMSGSQFSFAHSYYDRDFTDLIYELDLMREAGDPEFKSMGIMVRTENIFSPNREGYRFSVIPIGWWGIGKYVNGKYEIIISSEYNYSPAINTGLGAWNHLKVECRGQLFSYFINGVLMATITDSDFSAGDVALIFYEEGNEINHVDNIRAMQLPPTQPQEPVVASTLDSNSRFDEEAGTPR